MMQDLKVGFVRTVVFTDPVATDLATAVNAYTTDPARGEDRLLKIWFLHDGTDHVCWIVHTSE